MNITLFEKCLFPRYMYHFYLKKLTQLFIYRYISIMYSYLNPVRPLTSLKWLHDKLRVLKLDKSSMPSILLIWFADKSRCFRFLRWPRFSILWMKLLCRFKTWIWDRSGTFWSDLMPESIRQSSVPSKSILFIVLNYPTMFYTG